MSTDKKADTAEKVKDWSGGDGLIPGRDVLGPIFLMLATPCFSIIFFHVCANMEGNFVAFGRLVLERGNLITVLKEIWPDPWDLSVWRIILSFMGFNLFLMKAVPGKKMYGTVTPKGNTPVYNANGVACYIINVVTLMALAHFEIFNPAVVYDKFGNILSSMNIFALAFCAMLLIKGYVAPSSTDSGTTGSIIHDFYWGMELYPRILDWDVKVFTNCRSGMMFWAIGILCYCYKNMELNGGRLQYGMASSVAIQMVYLSKFYYWEMGYMRSMDIQHDRAGYYICWGCLVWVPAVYTSQAFYLTANAPDISLETALAIFVAGTLCVWINYDSDHQRYIFRASKGNCRIWGRSPPQHIVAEYKTSSGEKRTSLLLVDGWWRISRHFHYVPEILASFFWSLSALDSGLVGPYFYTFYLTILLTDRAFRDDDRCRLKYGPYWKEYCDQVPWKIVPGIV
eukprot:CAMPEP_0198140828 /NCGR_PEP_ID=MMETSP1443-20131203/3916_1 /TAXON_ID=186043 /ORGANISM="Entomoneis sp., Strain CCMP2396" /LENGTH=453 /DNA_ID=CAMNT_0043803363 /DNA_START=107 /DNA_END=1468 /DNA_ORIENTATION=+